MQVAATAAPEAARADTDFARRATAESAVHAERIGTTHRYPAHLIEHLTLEDGRRVTLRPVLPRDDVLTQAFVRHLSPQSRYNRFFVGLAELPPRMLAQMTDVDHVHHLALIAQTVTFGREVQVGEARYVVDESGQWAEFAIAVADDWQNTGIGSRLLRLLEKAARAAGIARMASDVLGSNRRAQEFMRQRGYALRSRPGEALLMRAEKLLGPW